jgi:hypothetical protein
VTRAGKIANIFENQKLRPSCLNDTENVVEECPAGGVEGSLLCSRFTERLAGKSGA